MDYIRCSLLLSFLLAFAIHPSKSHCENGICEKVSLSVANDLQENYALVEYIFQTFSFKNWEECFHTCLANCQCLSFNFNEVNATENCELNDANTKLAPEALKQKEGVNYYEPVRNYYDKKVRIISVVLSREFTEKKCKFGVLLIANSFFFKNRTFRVKINYFREPSGVLHICKFQYIMGTCSVQMFLF